MQVENWNIDKLIPFENNARVHDEKSIKAIKSSVDRFDWLSPIVVDKDGVIIMGHGRREAALELGMTEVPVLVADWLTENEVAAAREADNMTQDLSFFDFEKLNMNLEEIDWLDIDMSEFGFKLDDEIIGSSDGTDTEQARVRLAEKFTAPPFSILDARKGYWQERKAYWKTLIDDRGQARSEAGAYDSSDVIADRYGITFDENGVSILDPVLSECICSWFLPGNGLCIDPFAGDTVFGYVSTYLGNEFVGIEIRDEQVKFNQSIIDSTGLNGVYCCDDGRNILQHVSENSADLIFSCPPYFDLEKYSDLENDASNQNSFDEFYGILDTAFTNSIKALKDDRFAVIVVGNVRNKRDGFYYPFIDNVIKTFDRNGMGLYNHAILVTPAGSACIKANKYMLSRKMVLCHQDVLVFYKGNTKNISNVFPEIEVTADESEDV